MKANIFERAHRIEADCKEELQQLQGTQIKEQISKLQIERVEPTMYTTPLENAPKFWNDQKLNPIKFLQNLREYSTGLEGVCYGRCDEKIFTGFLGAKSKEEH